MKRVILSAIMLSVSLSGCLSTPKIATIEDIQPQRLPYLSRVELRLSDYRGLSREDFISASADIDFFSMPISDSLIQQGYDCSNQACTAISKDYLAQQLGYRYDLYHSGTISEDSFLFGSHKYQGVFHKKNVKYYKTYTTASNK